MGCSLLLGALLSTCQIIIMYFDMMVSLFLLVLHATLSFGRFVQFKLDLTWEIYSPDGNPRQMVLMNGQFPGPQLNLNYGDDVEVRTAQLFGPVWAHQPFRSLCITTFLPRQLFIFTALSNWVLHGPMGFLVSPRSPLNRGGHLYTDGPQLSMVHIGIMVMFRALFQTDFMEP